jgi:hypothetical protein
VKNYFIFVAAMFVLSSVHAGGNQSMVVEKPLIAQTLDAFNQEAARIREQMQPGGIYGLMKSTDKARVETRLGDMQKLLQDRATDNGMGQNDKIALVNAQEEVNGVLRHNDINRLVCERRAPVGTNIPVTTCRTFGEIEQARADSRKSMSDMDSLSRTSLTPTTRGAPGPTTH